MALDLSNIRGTLAHRFPNRVLTVDSHTAGEGTRLVVDGVGPIPGETMVEKLDYYRERLDHLRLMLNREPRGGELLTAQLTDPVTPGAEFGLIFMDARRYPYLCGHATIGAATTLIELEALAVDGPEARFIVDTPSGPTSADVRIVGNRVESVAIRMPAAFVFDTDKRLEVPGHGTLTVDLVCSGGFFTMVSAPDNGLSLAPEHRGSLVDLGMEIIDAANRNFSVHHPTRPEVRTVDVTEFYAPGAPGEGQSLVVYGESHMDRSPCGTGTAAKLALLRHRGLLEPGQPYRNRGPLGTVFEATIRNEPRIDEFTGAEAEIRGSAHITGIHEFFVAPDDPFPRGFLP
ncbi:MAG: proline racemase family protein [Desulfococcaceae bacterium]